jgi:hypothetical protein
MIKFTLLLLLLSSACTLSAAAPDPLVAEREAVWNSPEMLAARGYLAEYFAASKKYSAKYAKLYFERLQALSANQMRDWLADLEYRRGEKIAYYRQLELSRILAEQSQHPPKTRVEETPSTTTVVAPLTSTPKPMTQATAPEQRTSQISNNLDDGDPDCYAQFLRQQCEKFHALGVPCPRSERELVRGPVASTPSSAPPQRAELVETTP